MEYALKCVKKMQEENIRALEVKQAPTTQLNEYIDAWHAQKSIWAENCRSWYKKNTAEGRVYVWCGSMPHLLKSLKDPRFEHYDIRYRSDNMWSFLGNGSTVLEAQNFKGNPVDVAPYMRLNDHAWDVELPIVVEQRSSETKEICVVEHECGETKEISVESLLPIPAVVE